MSYDLILSSTVIAAIVSGLVYIINQRSSQVARYVVEQRENWRETIRTITYEILNADNNTIS